MLTVAPLAAPNHQAQQDQVHWYSHAHDEGVHLHHRDEEQKLKKLPLSYARVLTEMCLLTCRVYESASKYKGAKQGT